jgi:hypothetical protein
MIGDILSERVRDRSPANAIEQENILAEVLQHFTLVSLSRARLFPIAGFHGGTCLHILYGLNRFSEDLDFLLKDPQPDFEWRSYLDRIESDFQSEGIPLEILDKSHSERPIRAAMLKFGPLDSMPRLRLPYPRRDTHKIRIKLELDSNPPAGSRFETRYITMPQTAAVTTQNLESGFAGKSHALLCREYTKGRDWYDFLWYVSKGILPDLPLLGNALDQVGPWQGKGIQITPEWYRSAMRERIDAIDWNNARADVQRFIVAKELGSLEHWGNDLFLQQLDKLMEYW